MKTKNTSRAGFTLVEIMIVVAIIGLLAAIAIPNFVRARKQSQRNICINNLRMIDSAKQMWGTENKKNDTDTPSTAEVGNYLKNNIYPRCPAAATGVDNYTINPLNADPVCALSGLVGFEHKLETP